MRMQDIDRSQAILARAAKLRGLSSRLSARVLERTKSAHAKTASWITKTPPDFSRVMGMARQKPGTASPREEDEVSDASTFPSIPPRKRAAQTEQPPTPQNTFNPTESTANAAQNPFPVDEATAFARESAPQPDSQPQSGSATQTSGTEQEQIRERGVVMQGINQLRYGKELKALDKKIKDSVSEREQIEEKNKGKKRILAKHERTLKRLKRRRNVLRVVKWCLEIIALIIDLFGGAGVFVHAALRVLGATIRGMKPLIDTAEQAVKQHRKSQEKVIEQIDKITNIEQRVRAERRRLENTSLFSRGIQPQNETNTDIPLAA